MAHNYFNTGKSKEMYNIAFIKESCHPDLWVGDRNDSHIDLVKSSLLRIGPIGLLDIFGADFYIVKSNFSKASNQLRKAQLPQFSNKDYLEFEKKKQQYNFDRIPLRSPAQFSIDIEKIEFINYNIVISLNLAVPLKVRNKYPHILWLCLTGEGRYPLQSNGWDYFISHDFPTSPTLGHRTINIPYTFISPCFIEENYQAIKKEGIYLEINSISENNPYLRKNWADNIKGIDELKKLNLPISYHPGNTHKHIDSLASSTYFVKLGGRPVRGNSFLEAISAGCICFLAKSDCYGNILFPEYCYFSNKEQLIQKISHLEKNKELREKLIKEQRSYLESMIRLVEFQFDSALSIKRDQIKNKKNENNKISLKNRFKNYMKSILQPFISWTCYNTLGRLQSPVIDISKYIPAIFEEK